MISDLVEQLFRNKTRGDERPAIGPLFIPDGALPERSGERDFRGLAATQYAGTANKMDGATDFGRWDSPHGAFWVERGALGIDYSPCGGIGRAFGSIKSHRYPLGTKQYFTDCDYDAGDVIGWRGKVYVTPNGGRTALNGLGPSHTSGGVIDGTVEWVYETAPEIPYTFTAPIGSVHLGLSDFRDGEAAWESYGEGGRTAEGGTWLGRESDSFQNGALVVTYPCDMTPSGAVGNYWTVAGKSVGGPPVNPSSFAYAIGDYQQTFASGFIIGKNAIMPGGYAHKLHARAEHSFGWFNDAKQVVSMLYSLATSNAERIAAVFHNRMWALYCAGGLMASDESAAAAGTAPTDRVRRIAFAGTGYAELRAQNIASAASDLLLSGGNGGKLRMGNFVPYTGTATITGYFEVRDHATGQVRKLLCGEPS